MPQIMDAQPLQPRRHAQSPAAREFAEIWQAADKVVYSTTLEAAATTRTRIERDFDPQAVHTLLISGPLPWESACFGVRSPRHGRPPIRT
jgi:hypothetical protein